MLKNNWRKIRPKTDTTFEEFLVVDAAGRLQLPDALLKDGAIGDRVTSEKTDAGILIKPSRVGQ